MLITPAQVAIHCDRIGAPATASLGRRTRWTWIAGRRYSGIKRL